MVPGARTNFAAPIFESGVLWKQIYCIEGSILNIVGKFRRPPQSLSAPIVILVLGELLPLAVARYAPKLYSSISNIKISVSVYCRKLCQCFYHNAACKKLW